MGAGSAEMPKCWDAEKLRGNFFEDKPEVFNIYRPVTFLFRNGVFEGQVTLDKLTLVR